MAIGGESYSETLGGVVKEARHRAAVEARVTVTVIDITYVSESDRHSQRTTIKYLSIPTGMLHGIINFLWRLSAVLGFKCRRENVAPAGPCVMISRVLRLGGVVG
jgi:hypothetical protein